MRSIWLAGLLGLSSWVSVGRAAPPAANITPLPVVAMSNRVLPDIGFPQVIRAQQPNPSKQTSGWPRYIRTAIGENGQLLVFSVAEYQKLYPKDPDIQKLRQALLNKQTFPFAGSVQSQYQPPWLDLNPFDSASILHTQQKPLSFSGGQGIRYLGASKFDVSPLAIHDFYYVFQGLSHNGAYYFSLQVPIQAKMLPKTFSNDVQRLFTGRDTAAMITFIETQINQVALGSSKDFSPSLDTLDALVRSIQLK